MATTRGAQRRPTIVDIAKKVGVSPAAVSMVLRDLPGVGAETRQRILDAAAELKYRPDSRAKNLRSTSSQVLGVLYSLTSPFHADIVQWVYQSAEKHGFGVMLGGVGPDIPSGPAVEALLEARCDGIILVGPELMDARMISLAAQVPSVAIGHLSPRPGVDLVQSSSSEGIALAVSHLVGLGHRRISHLSGGSSLAGIERRQAYEHSMRTHGLETRIDIVEGDGTEVAGVLAAQLYLERGLPDAVVAYNDSSAVGLLFGLVRAGVSVPSDISITGYDDSHVASLPHIGLTSIAQRSPALAEAAVEAMSVRLKDGTGDTSPSLRVLSPHLVVRTSTGAAKSPVRPGAPPT